MRSRDFNASWFSSPNSVSSLDPTSTPSAAATTFLRTRQSTLGLPRSKFLYIRNTTLSDLLDNKLAAAFLVATVLTTLGIVMLGSRTKQINAYGKRGKRVVDDTGGTNQTISGCGYYQYLRRPSSSAMEGSCIQDEETRKRRAIEIHHALGQGSRPTTT